MERNEFWSNVWDRLQGRAKAQGWLKADGKFSKKGSDLAFEFIVGAAVGGKREEDPMLLLVSIRGAEELGAFVAKQNDK